jgi:hypothetical protein
MKGAAMHALEQELTQLELEEMVSFRKNVTGISHTIFISPRGGARHGPRVKVAIDPPDTLNPQGKIATVIVDGGGTIGDIDPQLADQVRRFIEINRETLLDYWHYRIDGRELDRRLKSLEDR